MKLIREIILEDLQYLKEETKGNKEKNYFITGIFMQAETANRNNRVYPIEILKREVEKYNENFIKQNRALGEMTHPDNPTINLERVSHLIKELKVDGNNVIGKAKILDTPYGKIAKSLMDEGIKLGVSSRGLGSLKENGNGIKEVQEDFSLAAIDIVADPSAPEAFVESVLENCEWILESGVWKAKEVEQYKKEIKKTNSKNLEKKMLKVFNNFMSQLKKV